jgi:hypothetical protein
MGCSNYYMYAVALSPADTLDNTPSPCTIINILSGYRKYPWEQRGKAAICIKSALCNARAVDQVTARGQYQLESRLTPSQIPSQWI